MAIEITEKERDRDREIESETETERKEERHSTSHQMVVKKREMLRAEARCG